MSRKAISAEPIGKVTSAERDEISLLYERRTGLIELEKMLIRVETRSNADDTLLGKVNQDLIETMVRYHEWWGRMSKKYQLMLSDGKTLRINFDTCEIHEGELEPEGMSTKSSTGE
jgi:CXXX repeat modification system protein